MTDKTDAETPQDDPAKTAEGAAEAQDQQSGADDVEAVAEARRNGWKPLAEFKGDPQGWVDHKAFNARGREILPIVKAQLAKTEKKLAEMEATLKEAASFAAKSDQRGYERARKELEQQLNRAVLDNDPAAALAISGEIADLASEVAAKPKPAPAETGDPPSLAQWKADNDWFETDRAMTGAAREIAQDLADRGITGDRQLAEVSKQIRAAFPHKFENPRRNGPGAVETPTGPGAKGGKTFADLPADAKAMCQRFERSIPNFKRDSYVKEYFAQ